VPPSIFDLLFRRTSIVGGRDQGYCTVDTNQDHGSDFSGDSRVPVHLAHALEHAIRTMNNLPPLESIPFANEWIDDIEFEGGVVPDVLDRMW
jgi:hypothetical protein